MNRKPLHLKKDRDRLAAHLPDPDQWIRGSLREAYLNCGRAQCRCHGAKRYRHGPYWYLSWTDSKGRTKSSLISPADLGRIRKGLNAYGKLWESICKISEINVALIKSQGSR